MSEILELLRVKEGEIIKRIEVTPKNKKTCEQMARRYTAKNKPRPLSSRMWFFSNETGIPVSERAVSRMLQNEIDQLTADRARFEAEKAEFEAWKASIKTVEQTPSEAKTTEAEHPKKAGRPPRKTSEEQLFEVPKQ